jgi:hypothetical protein
MRIQAQRLADGEHELFMESHIDPKIFKVEKKTTFCRAVGPDSLNPDPAIQVNPDPDPGSG